jgi:hypothetical protein
MRALRLLMLLGAGLLFFGCQTNSERTESPARIVDPSAESHRELVSVVRGALNGSQVTIADNALTETSLLIIEPKHLLGRDLRKPAHFQLLLSGSSCLLVHEETGARLPLAETVCIAE